MSKFKIGTVEAIALILSALAPFTVISLSRTFINETKSSALINIIYITIIASLITLLICKLFSKFPSFDIIDISNYLGGNIFRIIVGFVFIFYFLITSAMLLRNFCEGLNIVYYPFTKIIYIIMLFIIATAISNNLGFNSTIKTTALIFPVIMISIILLFIGNLNNFSFEKIFPLLGEGFHNTFVLGLVNIGAFTGISYLYFLPPLLKDPSKFKMISILSTILSGLFIFICVATLLFMFSIYVSTDEIIPLFSVSRYIEFGNFFQRFESLFLLIWTIAFCCYLSISFKFSTYIFKKIFKLKDSSQLIYIFSLLIFGITILPKNYSISSFFEIHVYRYISISIIFLGIILLLLSTLKKKVGD